VRIEPDELYQIRRLDLEAQRAVVAANLKRLEAMQAMLECEHKYGLLATDSTLDPETGIIKEAKADAPLQPPDP